MANNMTQYAKEEVRKIKNLLGSREDLLQAELEMVTAITEDFERFKALLSLLGEEAADVAVEHSKFVHEFNAETGAAFVQHPDSLFGYNWFDV
jgi:hypothetical protein